MSEFKSIISLLSAKYVTKLVDEKRIRYNPKVHITFLTKLLMKLFEVNYLGIKDNFPYQFNQYNQHTNTKIEETNHKDSKIEDGKSDEIKMCHDYITYIVHEIKKDLEIFPFEIDFNEMNLIMSVTITPMRLLENLPNNNCIENVKTSQKNNSLEGSYLGLSTSIPIKIKLFDESADEESDSSQNDTLHEGMMFQKGYLFFDDSDESSSSENEPDTNMFMLE